MGTACVCRILRLDFLKVGDHLCLLLPLWLFFARIGCFLAGCCYGVPVRHSVPWAVTFTDPHADVPRELIGVPLHPTQLYEAAGNLILLFFLWMILSSIRKHRLPYGLVCAGYFGGYGALRFVLEWFRADAQPFFGITTGQALSLTFLLISGVFLAVAFLRRDRRWLEMQTSDGHPLGVKFETRSNSQTFPNTQTILNLNQTNQRIP